MVCLLLIENLSEGHLVVQVGGDGAVDILGVVAHQVSLVPEGSVAADEAPLGRLGHQALRVLDRVADVEHLAVVVYVSVVPVLPTLAVE